MQRDSHMFIGWDTDGDGYVDLVPDANEWDNELPVSVDSYDHSYGEDVTITAMWGYLADGTGGVVLGGEGIQVYKFYVVIEGNGGSWPNMNAGTDAMVSYDAATYTRSTVMLPAASKMERSGYTFTGWVIKADKKTYNVSVPLEDWDSVLELAGLQYSESGQNTITATAQWK